MIFDFNELLLAFFISVVSIGIGIYLSKKINTKINTMNTMLKLDLTFEQLEIIAESLEYYHNEKMYSITDEKLETINSLIDKINKMEKQ